jgi:hypothetical protein
LKRRVLRQMFDIHVRRFHSEPVKDSAAYPATR